MQHVDHLSLLGVPPGASRETIKKSYRAKAKLCHPDLHPGKADEFRRLTAAYQALLNPAGMSTPRVRHPDAPHDPFQDFNTQHRQFNRRNA